MKLPLLVLAMACAACSSSTSDNGSTSSSSSSGGSSSGGLPATGSAALFTNLVASSGAKCSKAGAAVNVGGVGASGPVIASGSADNGHAVTVSCRVAPKAAGFDMQADIEVAGVGSFKIQSALDSSGNSGAASVSLTRGADGTWSSVTCKLDPSGLGTGAGVAAGRYWTAIACADAANPASDTCAISGAIRIENCVAQ